MTSYVALLRGVNVGGRIIKMEEIKNCFEDMGYTNVSTVLQTGNVLFDANPTSSEDMRNEIEMIVGSTFNYPAKVQIYNLDEVIRITKAYPFNRSKKTFQHYVVFLDNSKARQLAREPMSLDDKVEKIQKGDKVIYWMVKKGMTTKSLFSKFLLKPQYKQSNTVRNINTLQKLENKHK
ncbi:DUF1697 domain-containing protein [Candidatus Saccharibacteria bacterium]|nr:DUF1697 domain-containing protein [Candidatus Saccharibacteria bacterium]